MRRSYLQGDPLLSLSLSARWRGKGAFMNSPVITCWFRLPTEVEAKFSHRIHYNDWSVKSWERQGLEPAYICATLSWPWESYVGHRLTVKMKHAPGAVLWPRVRRREGSLSKNEFSHGLVSWPYVNPPPFHWHSNFAQPHPLGGWKKWSWIRMISIS